MGALAGFAALHALHQAGQLLGRHQPVTDATLLPLAFLHAAVVPLAALRPRAGLAIIAALGAWQCVSTFPRTGNHVFLGVVVSLLVALLDEHEALDRQLRRRLLLALPLVVFVWSGVQKLVHGYWFEGQFLAWAAVSRVDIALVMRPLLEDGVAAQLASLPRTAERAGPFRLPGVWAWAANAVWLVELASPAALLPLGGRAARWLLLTLTWALQVLAHEWEFALLFTNVLLLDAPPRASGVGRVATLAGVLALAAGRLGLWELPELLRPGLEVAR